MNLARFGIAIIITIVLLGVARRISTRHPTDFSRQVGDVTATHRTVTEDFGDGPVLDVALSAPDSLMAVVNYSQTDGGPYTVDTLTMTENGFRGELPDLEKGKKWFYYIDLYKDKKSVAKLPPFGTQFIKFKGHVPAYILVPHIFCMFAIVFFGLLTVFSALDLARGKGDIKKTVGHLHWTVIFAFVGGFPLGYLVAYMAFGVGWGGIPFGWDITDNKTVLLFIFWLVTLILARRGLKGEKMAISNNVYLALTVISLAVTIFTFMIPHSI
ncbi:MAG: hypothetical protein V3W18_04605 [candidate division Zixibacteria bacterium]